MKNTLDFKDLGAVRNVKYFANDFNIDYYILKLSYIAIGINKIYY